MVVLDPRGDIDQLRETSRVAFWEAIGTEAFDLFETAPGEVGWIAARDHPPDESVFIGVQRPVAPESAHGLAQVVGLLVGELGGDHGDLHGLFLEQGDPEGLLEDIPQFVLFVGVGRRGVDGLLHSIPATQIGVDHVALDRTGPHDGDLDDEVVDLPRFQPGQHVDLGPAFYLEDADGMAPAQHVVDGRIGRLEIMHFHLEPGMLPQQVEGLADAGQHAERQHIDLHQPQGVDVVLVPFDEGAVGHGRIADGDQFVQSVLGQDEAADVLGQVTRRVEQACRHLDRPGDHRIGRVQAGLTDVAVADLRPPASPLAGGQAGGDVLG
ncbi:hypothetical protein D3C72_631260 [compost metagenome]